MPEPPEFYLEPEKSLTEDLWHGRMGHHHLEGQCQGWESLKQLGVIHKLLIELFFREIQKFQRGRRFGKEQSSCTPQNGNLEHYLAKMGKVRTVKDISGL
jgi:hypothetical protein